MWRIEFFLYAWGSSMNMRAMRRISGGMAPRSRVPRQTARRWLSPKILYRARATSHAIVNARSSCELVAQMKRRCCFFLWMPSFSVASAAATDPEGYSPPRPIPRKKRNAIRQLMSTCGVGPALHAVRMEKTKMMAVQRNMANLRPILSEIQPNAGRLAGHEEGRDAETEATYIADP